MYTGEWPAQWDEDFTDKWERQHANNSPAVVVDEIAAAPAAETNWSAQLLDRAAAVVPLIKRAARDLTKLADTLANDGDASTFFRAADRLRAS